MTATENNPGQQPKPQRVWQASSAELTRQYQTDLEQGLTEKQAAARLKRDGFNELKAKRQSNLIRFLKQFNNSIIYILAAAALLTLSLQHYSDSVVIGAVIIANALIGFFQERQADNALAQISRLLVTENFVIRDGVKQHLPARQLVVGDLVLLEAGDAVPADLRLISADSLKIQESILTGEADSVEKVETALIADEIPLAERANLAFASTAVTQGSGIGVVIATATQTEIGQIQQNVSQVKEKPTPLMQNLNQLGFGLSVAIVIAAVLLFILGLITHVYSLPTLLIAVITMVVGSMPEGLPASTSMVLALGVRKMTAEKAIVKTLPAVETLGAVDIVNTDKTGTLTKNEMTVTEIMTPQQAYQVTGVGFTKAGALDLSGELQVKGQPVTGADDADLQWLLEIAGQTTDAMLVENDGQWELNGEPTDGALTGLYYKLKGHQPEVQEIDSLPFDSAWRYSARLVDHEGQRYLFAKGAPATLLKQATLPDDTWAKQEQQLTEQGLRVVAFGYQTVANDVTDIQTVPIDATFKLVGLVGMIDPPREEVKQAIGDLRQAGVQVKMITGDHPVTASAIARQLELSDDIQAITGPELAALNDDELTKKIDHYNVFARTTPTDKLRIVRAQQANHHVVAMTGDGVNDAAALKQADIGVAMGIKGTEVAKAAANMVLADDDFTTIVKAVKAGRHIFDNIRKTIRFLLPTSFAEGLIVVLSILFGQELPLFPTQLLWINMVSALTIQFAFIFEPPEHGLMRRGPRDVRAGLLHKPDVIEIGLVSFLIAGLGLLAFHFGVTNGMSTAIGSTMTLNIVIFGKIFYLFNLRNQQPLFSKEFFKNKMAFLMIALLIVLQLIIIYVPIFQTVFHTTTINFLYGWLVPIIAGIIVVTVVSLFKHYLYHILRKHQQLMTKA
jgi:magnesium-transporting ATPase (P-type)